MFRISYLICFAHFRFQNALVIAYINDINIYSFCKSIISLLNLSLSSFILDELVDKNPYATEGHSCMCQGDWTVTWANYCTIGFLCFHLDVYLWFWGADKVNGEYYMVQTDKLTLETPKVIRTPGTSTCGIQPFDFIMILPQWGMTKDDRDGRMWHGEDLTNINWSM